MTRTFRHMLLITLSAFAAFGSARAQFSYEHVKDADKVAASKYFVVSTTQVSTYEISDLSLPVSTTTTSILYVQSTQKTTGVHQSAPVPAQFVLSQNFPNPFNGSTKISYTIPVQSNVTLVVYDITGREIVTLVRGSMSAGTHIATFNIEGIASGAYYYRMVAVGASGLASVETKKMIVMK